MIECTWSILTVFSPVEQILDHVCKYIKINICSSTEIKNVFASIDKLIWSYAQIIFLASFAKDYTVRLDGTRPPPKECLQVYRKVWIWSIVTVCSQVCQILDYVCKYIKVLYTCIYKLVWSYAQIIFLAGFAGQGILDKDCKVRLDRSRPPPKEFLQVYRKVCIWSLAAVHSLVG